jgi:hypothetical protein
MVDFAKTCYGWRAGNIIERPIMLILALTIALVGAETSAHPSQTAVAPVTNEARFAGRPAARIPFARDVRNFQVKREGSEDVLFLETNRDTWYRSEINCLGIGDPRDAHGIVPERNMSSIDSFSRITLVALGSGTTQCSLQNLVALTPEEAVEFRLIRRTRPARTQPAS